MVLSDGDKIPDPQIAKNIGITSFAGLDRGLAIDAIPSEINFEIFSACRPKIFGGDVTNIPSMHHLFGDSQDFLFHLELLQIQGIGLRFIGY